MRQPIKLASFEALPTTADFDCYEDTYVLLPEFWNTNSALPEACVLAMPEEIINPGDYCVLKLHNEALPCVGVFMGQAFVEGELKAIFANPYPAEIALIDPEEIEALHRGYITDEDEFTFEEELLNLHYCAHMDPNMYQPANPDWRPWHGYLH